MYLDELADEIREHVPADTLPEGDTSGLFLIYAALLLAKGEHVTRADVHNAWVAWMAGEDAAHESLIPYEGLDAATQAEDSPYVVAIRTVAQEMRERNKLRPG